MAKPDQHFTFVFSSVLGILILIALVLIGVSRFVDSGPKGARDTSDPLMQSQAHERIKPFGQVAVAGEDNAALTIQAPAIAAAGAAGLASAGGGAAVQAMDGPSVSGSACVVCHGAGIAGAPRVGDKAAWTARIAQGNATLYKHALEGYTGSAGFMPAKGGRMDLPDEAVKAAVDHMVAQSR
jgi:cytochrome c5